MNKAIFRTIFLSCLLLETMSLFAQEQKDPPSSQESDLMKLAKASQNPVADMNTVPVQFNWLTGGGLGSQTLSQTLLQPVLPLPISKKFNVVSRTVVPIMAIPTPTGGKLKGIADIQEQLYFSPSHSNGIIWGVGPVFSLPTSTISEIATGQFALGPTAVILVMPGKFVLGTIANQMWRIAGDRTTTTINSFFVQPFINYNFKMGWSMSTAPTITSNWSAKSGQQWTLPIGLGISKITTIGKQPLNLSVQYYHNAIRPDNTGADQIRMVVALLFPR